MPNPTPHETLEARLRRYADVNCNPDPDPASREDLPYVTWAELDEMSQAMREAADALRAHGAARERRACDCQIPDPVMQADGQFYCHTCSFQTGARPAELPEAEVATLVARVAELEADERRWRCFHCGEVFTDRDEARRHFGFDESKTPACRLSGVDVSRLRELEADNAQLRHDNEELENDSRLWHGAEADRVRRIGHREWWQELDYREGEKLVLIEKLRAAEEERDKATALSLASERFRSEDAANHLDEQAQHIKRWQAAEATVRTLEADLADCRARRSELLARQDEAVRPAPTEG